MAWIANQNGDVSPVLQVTVPSIRSHLAKLFGGARSVKFTCIGLTRIEPVPGTSAVPSDRRP